MGGVRRGVNDLLENHGLTILFTLSLLLVYELQLIVFSVYPDHVFVWLFTAESVTSPSPGWILSSLSHGSLQHLAANASILLLAGGLSEPHFRKSEYIVFFFGVGLIASLAHIAIWPVDAPMLGTSGTAFGFMGYSMYHYAQRHHDRLLPRATFSPGLIGHMIEDLKFGYVVLGFPVMSSGLVLALVGVIETGDAADGAHLFGFLLGVLYVYVQPATVGNSCS